MKYIREMLQSSMLSRELCLPDQPVSGRLQPKYKSSETYALDALQTVLQNTRVDMVSDDLKGDTMDTRLAIEV